MGDFSDVMCLNSMESSSFIINFQSVTSQKKRGEIAILVYCLPEEQDLEFLYVEEKLRVLVFAIRYPQK